MSRKHHWKTRIPERAWRSAATAARRHYLALTAVAAAVVLGVSLAPLGLSEAAASAPAAAASAGPASTNSPAPTDDGLTWSPTASTPYQGADSAGCQLYSY